MSVGIEVWLAFGAGVVSLVLIDLLVLNRHADTVSLRSASRSTAAFVAIAIAFGALLAVTEGSGPAGQFYAGYLLELSLSIDNVFVWALIFSTFGVPEQYQRRVLFWGILVAFALRGAFIAAGSQLLAQFEWIVYVFGALLLWSAIRILRQDDGTATPARAASTARSAASCRRRTGCTASGCWCARRRRSGRGGAPCPAASTPRRCSRCWR